MAFTVAEEQAGNVTILHLAGRLDASNAQTAEESLFAYLEPEARLALDFAEVQFVSSAGLRIFLMMAKKIKAQRGALALYALPSGVREVFEISGFSKILTIREARDEALAALA